MVRLDAGYYLCHSFDLGSPLSGLERFQERPSLTTVQPALRYIKIKHSDLAVFVSQAGATIVLQKIDALSIEGARSFYDSDKFNTAYRSALQEVNRILGQQCVDFDSTFLACFGAHPMQVEWNFVRVPNDQLHTGIFIEAVFIAQLCSSIEKRSSLFIEDARSAVHERTILQFIESLFSLGRPQSFLMDRDEIGLMSEFFCKWGLSERIARIRETFAQSVSNAAIFNGRVERHWQSAMNCFVASLAVLALIQVNRPVVDLLRKVSISASEAMLNEILALVAVALLAWGIARHILWDACILRISQYRRRRLTRKLMEKGSP